MKKIIVLAFFLLLLSSTCFSEIIETDILGKWYYIPNIDEYNSVLAHDVQKYVDIQKNENNYTIRFTLGINYDHFESKNVTLVKNKNNFIFTGNFNTKNGILSKTLIFNLIESEENNYLITFDEPNSEDINGVYIKKNSIINHYIEIKLAPNLDMYGYTNSESVRLRDSYGINGAIITKLINNTKVIILNRSEKEDIIDGYKDYWLKVKVINSGMIGWIYGGYIDLDQEFFKD